MCKSCTCCQQGPSVCVFRISLTRQFTGHCNKRCHQNGHQRLLTHHTALKAHTVPMFHTVELGFEHLPGSGQGVRCCGGYNVESLLL